MGLVQPTEGEILIDDININEINPESLRKAIGYMPQTAVLFKGTILDNLVMFDYQYEEKAKALCKQFGLSKLIEYFPDGYDTKVATQTTDTLPRGMQQQIVIIRALARDPSILLFDEADVTIDLEGDQKIKEFMQSIKGIHTLIIASHRPSVIALADKKFIITQSEVRQL
jgi:ATP-binding cassette subfamily C protein LapB